MKVIIARFSGFCGGVRRAMRLALEASEGGGVWADGPLVHNEQAVRLLSLRGVAVSPAPGPGHRRVLIRAHGAPPEALREWAEQGLVPVDATCGHVARSQRLAREAAAAGTAVVLAGDPDHAEVRAVMGSAGGRGRVISSVSEAETFQADAPLLFLAQTTFNAGLFREMAAVLRRRFPGCRIAETICRATHDRQDEAARIARLAECLVVVGGRHSANTGRLAEMGRAQGRPVFLVETADELRSEDFAAFSSAAVISGASTPGWITQDVISRLRRMGRPSAASAVYRGLHFLAESRISAAASAAGLALAAQFHLLESLEPASALAGAGFVFFAHTLNRRVPEDREIRRLSRTDSFYRSRRRELLAAAWCAAAVSLLLAAAVSPAVLALFAAALSAAAAYAFAGRLTESAAGGGGRGRSHIWRTFVMTAGWTAVLGLPPMLEAGASGSGWLMCLFLFLLCLGGTLLRDLHDVASDRLMGIRTLPSRLGVPAAMRLTAGVLTAAACLPLAEALAAALGRSESGVWTVYTAALALSPALGGLLLGRMRACRLPDAVLLQAGADGMGCLAGAAALIAGGLLS